MMRRKFLRRLLMVACFVLLSVPLFLGDNSLQKVQAATKVKINKKSVTLRYKRYTYLRVKGTSKKVKWSSTKKTVARVNSSGKVTAVGHGSATIKAKVKVKKKNKTFKCKILVPYTFANDNLREEHYLKHGKEMGFNSAADYEKAAAKVVADKSALHKKEAEDGDDVYYLEKSNELVIVSIYGFIRTYFSPEDGIDYFNRT